MTFKKNYELNLITAGALLPWRSRYQFNHKAGKAKKMAYKNFEIWTDTKKEDILIEITNLKTDNLISLNLDKKEADILYFVLTKIRQYKYPRTREYLINTEIHYDIEEEE